MLKRIEKGQTKLETIKNRKRFGHWLQKLYIEGRNIRYDSEKEKNRTRRIQRFHSIMEAKSYAERRKESQRSGLMEMIYMCVCDISDVQKQHLYIIPHIFFNERKT